MSSRQTKFKEFSIYERDFIKIRDRGCIFCQRKYHMEDIKCPGMGLQIMHLIPRSQGGLGIRQNGAVGCIEHHQMMDNGSNGRREEMIQIFREHLELYHPGFKDSDRVYQKWGVT